MRGERKNDDVIPSRVMDSPKTYPPFAGTVHLTCGECTIRQIKNIFNRAEAGINDEEIDLILGEIILEDPAFFEGSLKQEPQRAVQLEKETLNSMKNIHKEFSDEKIDKATAQFSLAALLLQDPSFDKNFA